MAELQKAQRIAFYSVLVNVGPTLGKAGLAFLTGSTVLWAETLHALVDLAASAVTWMGIRVARLKNKELIKNSPGVFIKRKTWPPFSSP